MALGTGQRGGLAVPRNPDAPRLGELGLMYLAG